MRGGKKAAVGRKNLTICIWCDTLMNMRATRTIRIELSPTHEQRVLLQQTMQEYTACFNDVCQLADIRKISNSVDLHKETYAQHRATTHLPSQLICAAEFVDARYSSQCCSRCGHIDKRNRLSQSEFSCRQCGFQCNADLNASYNLARRAKSASSGLPLSDSLSSQLLVS
jgi:hypothetical protein